MEKKSNGFLKVTGILMIIGGGIGIIVGMLAVTGVALLSGAGYNSTLLTVGAIFAVVSAVVSLVAGILGVANAAKPEKAMVCIVCGILTVLMAIIGTVITMVGGGQFPFGNLLTGLVLPVLYLIGAFQNKSRAV